MTRQDKKDFEVFQKEFKYWQEKLGCLDWKVCFEHEDIKDSLAQICTNNNGRIATVTLDKDTQHIKEHHPAESAKHEALHLLLADIGGVAYNRFTTPEVIDREEEKLVVKLMGLIK